MSKSELKLAAVFEDVDISLNTRLIFNPDGYWADTKNGDLYKAYGSKYSGSFPLGDTLKYPRMCASASINMTGGNGTGGVQYYRGQNEVYYKVGEQSNASLALRKMNDGTTWIFQNGTEATGLLGRFDRNAQGGMVYIYTESEDAIGI